MITKTSATITNLKNLFIEMFLDKTAKVSNVADGSVVNATAFGVAKVAQKAMKDIAIKEAQIFPDTATGAYLDKAAALYGVSPRKGALGSSTYIRVSAEPGTTYDTSVTFVNKNGIRFQVDEALIVGESGYGYVKVRSVNAGYSTNVPPNSITNVSPQPQGHIECTNEYYAIGGRDSEDDETFRIRIKNNLNILSKNTIEYWTQTLNNIDDRVLKVMSAGLDEKGIYNLYIVSQNGIFFTEEELETMLESVQGYFGLSELNIEGKAVGIGIKNIDWFYVGSERGLDFRVQLQPDYDVATVRQNIQVNLTKYLDFRFWTPGKIVEWDDLLDIVKKTNGVKYVPDEYFFPYYDQQVPANQLPRIRGFVMRDQDGNILYDSDSNLSPLFYPAESEDLFVGINDSSLNLYQSAYFTIKDSDGKPVKSANISVGNNTITTNEQGQATIQLANGQYEYIVSRSGYIPVEGVFVILNGSVFVEVELIQAPYTVTFHVTDEKGGTVPYANVKMNNRATTTNIEGVATLSARNGNYPYTIEKLGYDEYSNNVVVEGSNKDVYVEMEFTVWTITVIAKDKENELIPNAIVKVNNGEYPTNQQGEVSIPLVNGEYPVTIEKTGYDTLQGIIKVNNQNADVTFEMDFFLYTVEFNISQVSQGNPAEGAQISIDGVPGTLTVDSSGKVTTQLKNGDYNYTITKRGYDNLTGSFNITGSNVFIQRTLDLKHYNVTITVLDSDNSSVIQGAAVNINSSTYPTNERGQVNVSLQNGTYSYTVTKSGYYNGDSSVTVLDSDNSSVISLQARLYNVIMTVKDPTNQPIENAIVAIGGGTYETQSNGQVSLQLKNGEYSYTVTAGSMDDYFGEIEVASADIPSVIVKMEYKKYDIQFTVQTDEGITIGDANIHINENDYKTTQGGLAIVRLSNGSYPYTVTKEGYIQQQGEVVVSGAAKDVLVQMIPLSYEITFVVKDNMASSNLLQGVSVKIEGKDDIITTNTSGEATISLKSGNYTAIFTKGSYKTEVLLFEVTKEETFTQILKRIWQLSFKVNVAEKVALEGVAINVSGSALVDGDTSLTTKSDGTTDPIDVINGAYDWNALLTGYSPEEGVGSIQDADQEKVVELTYGFETTFMAKSQGLSAIYGLYVQDTEHNFYTKSEWEDLESKPTPNAIAVFDPKASFLVGLTYVNPDSPHMMFWGSDKLVDGVMATSDPEVAITDFSGYENTQKLVSANVGNGAVKSCSQFVFPDGETGYMGGCGEFKILQENVSKIKELISLVGGDPIEYNGGYHWTSTQGSTSDKAWTVVIYDESSTATNQEGRNVGNQVRAFGYLDPDLVPKKENAPIEGVKITIDGSDTITTGQDGTAKTNLSTGTHTYAYSKTGFLNGTGNVEIEEAEKSVQITLVPGATTTFHTKVGNSVLTDVKIVVSQSSARSLPETIVTNSQGIATIDLPTGNYQYQIPTTSIDNPNLVEVPNGEFSVATTANTIELDLADYVKYNVTFQTVPPTQGVAISFAKEESPDTPVASGATASNGTLTLAYKNGQYVYTAKKSGYIDVTGKFTVADEDQNISVEMSQSSTVTFTVKSQSDDTPIENAVVEMVDQSDSSNKYKGTTNPSGVATMTFDGGEFDWSQDSDADFSGCPVFKEDENYPFSDNITTDQIKTYFPNGVVVSPITVVHNEDDAGQVVSVAYMYNSQKINGWEGSWDETKKNFTLTSVIKESTPTLTEGYILFNVDAGFLMVALGLLTPGTEGIVDYHKSLDFGFKVSGVPSNLKIVVNYGSANEEFAAEMENDVIQRFQLSDLLLEEIMTNSTIWQVDVQSSDGSTLSTDDLKNLNITFSFYGKKTKSSDIPVGKVLYGNYDYTVTPPSPLEAQSGTLNVNAPAVNKEILIANNTNVTFKVYEKSQQALVFRPKVGDFVYSDKTWSTVLDDTKDPVGVITDVRSKDFDFIALQNLNTAFWTNTLGIISDVTTETDTSLVMCDFAGKKNTLNIILAKPTESTAAHECAAYTTEGFGNSWYLPSCGQWAVAQLNRFVIEASIRATGGDIISSLSYWTSTQSNSNNAWSFGWGNGAKLATTKATSNMVRPFCTYEYNPVPNGIYIYDKNNNRYTKEDWALSSKEISDVCGIGISTDTNSFMVSTNISTIAYAFGGEGTLISNVPMLTTAPTIADIPKATHGFIYTDAIISQLGSDNAPAAKYVKSNVFRNNQRGYLPSYGEVTTLYSYKTQVEEILNMLGLSLWNTTIQTCTQIGNTNNAAFVWTNGNYYLADKNDNVSVLLFTLLPFKEGVEEGIYILDTDDNFTNRYDWDIVNNSKAVGVAVLSSKCQFVIARTGNSNNQKWTPNGAYGGVPGVMTTTDTNTAKTDYKGAQNSSAIVGQYGSTSDYAAGWCQNFLFKNGGKGYLGSAGEWQEAYNNKDEIDACISLIGGEAINTNTYLWASTAYNTNSSWVLAWSDGAWRYTDRSTSSQVRAFAPVSLANKQPIQNALVKMTSTSNNYQESTNASGVAVISAALGVDYDYEVSADGYVPQNGEIGVLSEAKEIEVNLQPASELTVVVHRNTSDGATDMSAVSVIVTENKEGGGQVVSGTTSPEGTVVLFVPNGSYKVSFSKDGFEGKEETVEVSGETTLNTFLLQIYSALNVQVRRVGQMQGMPSQIQLKNSTGTEVIQTESLPATIVTFTNVTYGQYILYVPEGDYSKEASQSVTVNSEGMQVQVNLTPLYMVQVKVNPSGGIVKFTDSEGKAHTGSAAPVTYTARFDKIPAGNYSVEITSEGFNNFSTTGSIENVWQESVNLEYTLSKPNKLVQITSNQSSYVLDTSYKYVSMLLVGRGGRCSIAWSSWGNFRMQGGTTGLLMYIPNIRVSDLNDEKIQSISFSTQPNSGNWVVGTTMKIRIAGQTYTLVAYNGQLTPAQDKTLNPLSVVDIYPIYSAKSSGGVCTHVGTNYYVTGSYGSQNADELLTTSSSYGYMQPDGAEGGDGTYGYSTPRGENFADITNPITSKVPIPVQSIFGGTSEGAAGYLNTNSGLRTGAACWGGAGYGESFETIVGTVRTAGYGSGQCANPADVDAGNTNVEGSGIVCLYYHNDPLFI